MDSVEKVQTRSLRQTRSSRRGDSSNPPLTRNMATRHGRTTTSTDSPKVDIQEVIKQEIEMQDAVEKEPLLPPAARRGRLRKQPQQTAAKSEEKSRAPSKEEGDIQESENEKPYEQVVSEENVPKKVEEEDEPIHEVLDLLKEDQIKIKATETFVVKIDKSLQEGALAEDKLLFEEKKSIGNAGQIQEKAVELEREMTECMEGASASAIVERETSESFDETAKQTAMDEQKQSGSLSDQASKEEEDIREVAILEAKTIEKQAIRTTRLTRSGKLCLSEEISPRPQRTSRRNETKQQSKSESLTEKDDKGLSKTCEIVEVKSFKDEAESTESKKEENSPQVASKRRGRARKQTRKCASKSDVVKADGQSTEEWKESDIEQDKIDNVEKQEMEIVLEEMPKNEDDIHEVVDLVEKDQGLGEECSDVISETLEKCEDGQPSEEGKNASEISKEEDTIEKEGVEEAKGLTEFEQGHSENVEWQKQHLEAPETTGNSDLEKSRRDATEKESTEGPKPLEDQTTSEDMAEDVEFARKEFQVTDSADGQATTADTRDTELIEQDCKLNLGDFCVDARDKNEHNEQELAVDCEDVQPLEQEKAEMYEGKGGKVDLETVNDEEKFPDTKENEQREGLRTEEEEPKGASALEPQPENLETPDEEETAAAEEETSETKSKSDKQKHEDGTEEVPDFLVGDRVGDVKEEETLKSLGQGRKSARKTNVGSKRRTDVEGLDSKRSRSLSPSVPSDTKLPPFRPNNPLGQEYVIPKSGFFCDLCSMFYLNETTAREQHCSSRQHYDNLKKHLERQSQGAT